MMLLQNTRLETTPPRRVKASVLQTVLFLCVNYFFAGIEPHRLLCVSRIGIHFHSFAPNSQWWKNAISTAKFLFDSYEVVFSQTGKTMVQ
jgi:hypothetical protein